MRLNTESNNRAWVWKIPTLLAALSIVGLAIWRYDHRSRTGPAERNPASTEATALPAAPDIATATFPQPVTDALAAQWIAQWNHPGSSLKERRAQARQTALTATGRSLQSLRATLGEVPSQVTAAIAEGLGANTDPAAKAILVGLLEALDETTARGAVRGLAAAGDEDAVRWLADILNEDRKPLSVRTEAALVLGDLDQPSALITLSTALSQSTDETVIEHILQGLGKRPFAETRQTLQGFIESPGTSSDLRVAALEALAGATGGELTPFLLKYAGDSDASVRAAASWALGATAEAGNGGSTVLQLLARESDTGVRVRLYQALGNQSDCDLALALESIRTETQTAARLAGLDFLADQLRVTTLSLAQAYFAQTGVPELKRAALSGEAPSDRLAAALALGRAKTPESLAALRDLAQQSGDPQIRSAAHSALGLATSR